MITTNIINRTFHIATKEDLGSAFSMEHEGTQYLITAKHVLDSIDFENGDEINIQVYHDNQWKNLLTKAYLHENEDIDIVVLKTNQVEFYKLPVSVGMENLFLSRDIFFLGFPYGMFTPDKGTINQKFPIPFVKKGILSAIDNQDGITCIYVDAHNNNGFSGGPVITVDKDNKVQIIGVNVSFIVFEKELEFEEQDEDGNLYDEKLDYDENSGIMKAHGIDHAKEIIEKIGS
jgi:S1-C subfamily serine protease